jgi:hypothetical protein
MKKILCSFLILFNLSITKVEAQNSEAADEILFKIVKAGIAVKEEKQLNQDDLREIVCLTNIGTKKWDGNFVGAFYFPSKREIQLWKDWFEENKTRISYSTNSDIFNEVYFEGKRKLIQVEYENGKFRNAVCGEDQNFQEVWQKRNKKN